MCERSGRNGKGTGTSSPVLFDSDILIDFLNGVQFAADLIGQDGDRAVSIITWIEVSAGARTPEAERLSQNLLSVFEVLGLSDAVADAAATIRRERRLKLPDAIILATARSHRLRLVTRNTKDFRPDDGDIIVPYRL